ncbi:MAG TPA: SCO family protein [Pyrinomonadaceae bacterium]|jgi:hypothetical protein|nr:SCO family protein [Pyrinomonadaceae bacterium]
MKYKSAFLIVIISLVLMVAISPLRGFRSIQESSLIGFVAYLYLTLFCLKVFKSRLTDWQIFSALLLGLWLLQLPIRITHFEGTLGTLPDMLLHTLGIVCGLFYWKIKRPFDLLPLTLCCVIVVFMYFQGYDFWFNERNYGTFTGRVAAYELPVKFEAFDEQKNTITENDFNGKVVLLDFWFTRCGACFEKFPQVQSAFDKLKSDPSVVVFAIDKPIEEDKPRRSF